MDISQKSTFVNILMRLEKELIRYPKTMVLQAVYQNVPSWFMRLDRSPYTQAVRYNDIHVF